MAKERGVMVGAHPGYPDLLGFGRRKMVLSHDEVKNYVRYQIGALAAFTKKLRNEASACRSSWSNGEWLPV